MRERVSPTPGRRPRPAQGSLVAQKELSALEVDDFLDVVIHDLKAPLATIRGMAQLAARHLEQAGEHVSVERLRKIDAQVERMKGLLNELLEAQMLAAGKLVLRPAVFPYGALLDELTQRWRGDGREVSSQPPPGLCVRADRSRVAQILEHLVACTLRRSPTGRARLLARGEPGQVVTELRAEHEGKADPEPARIAGHGMGLFVAAQLVRAHGGRLWLSAGPRAATTLAFSLPIS